ncbi:hypothetical protein Hanom_Chr03g00235021 [Helianthus anomalus]
MGGFELNQQGRLLLPLTLLPPPSSVTIANGNPINCAKMCKGFKWMMHGMWFDADVLLTSLENYA